MVVETINKRIEENELTRVKSHTDKIENTEYIFNVYEPNKNDAMNEDALIKAMEYANLFRGISN